MCGDPKALAWCWIHAYAENLNSNGYEDEDYNNVSPDELIDTAMINIESDSEWNEEYISKGGLLEGVSVDPTFWDKLAILKDREIPNDKRNSFFSCSC